MEDKIAQFRSITDAPLETATQLLDACGGDLQTAIELFFQQNDTRPIQNDEEIPSSSDGADSNSAGVNADELVRAPIAAKSATLVEESFQRSYAPLRRPRQADSVFERFRDFEAETSKELMNLRLGEREAQIAAQKPNGAGNDNKMKTLAQLFRPPVEIMHRGGSLETAKSAAVAEEHWLLVNVQKTDEFACQVLNRDVWNNSAVQDLVRNNFVLWQIYSDTAEGQRFQAYYRVQAYPHICILDPRTGELLASLKAHDPVMFCDDVSTFLEANPHFKARDMHYQSKRVVNPEPTSGSTATIPKYPEATTVDKNHVQISGGMVKSGGKRRLNDDGAMDESTADHTNGHSNTDTFGGPKAKAFRMDDDDSSSGVSTSSSVTGSAQFSSSRYEDKKPDSDNANVEGSLVPFGKPDVRLMFRFPDGSKRYLNAPKTATVQDVLSYVEGHWQLTTSNHEFIMNYPTRQLNKSNSNKKLEELGVRKQDVIYVEEI